jgi:23S rRNA pseudouridine1911/1915/1917 synthase
LLEVIYEDNHIIAVNKKPGDIVQGDKTGDSPLSDFVKQYIKDKYKKPGEVFLGTPHRIDRPVSGIVLFARTSKALERLNKMFHDKLVTKTYWAVVKNKPIPESGHLCHYMKKDEARNKSRTYNKEVEGSKKAELDYRLVASLDNYHLIEVNPITGRSHQIRAQLAALGCPIKGDVKYGFARTNQDASIHLHARKIELMHPVQSEPLIITADPPQTDVLWREFLKKMS